MKINLRDFQEDARKKLRRKLNRAAENYAEEHESQIISFTAITGAGKTVILISLVESVYNGDAKYPAQDDAIFVWLSDSPELNEQSRKKFSLYGDDSIGNRLVTLTDENFNDETLADGKIYFLNTQKLSKTSNLTRQSELRTFTIWDTLRNTAAEKSARLCVIIDEAHRGAKNQRETLTIMQKFIKGSEADGLKPMPLVIGMSATPDRFNALAGNAGSTLEKCAVPNEAVKEAGLLKERIIVVYPEKDSGSREMSMLTEATRDWLNKCAHWSACDASVKPVFIVQVQSGTGGKISDTDLDECLRAIEAAVGKKFQVGEVVHTFGETADLTLNGLQVVYKEPSGISGDETIKVVLFKENLSTGWDCPRAETMMSFRRAVDKTYIAQLIGRMIRTPLQKRITEDETLNEVCLFLPKFDPSTVQEIIDKLKGSELGAVTNIDAHVAGERTYETWTVTPKPPSTDGQTQATAGGGAVVQAGGLSLTPLELSKKNSPLNREEVLDFLNKLALPTYRVKPSKTVNRLTALIGLAQALTWSEIYPAAFDEVFDSLVDMIRAKVDALKAAGEYDDALERLTNFRIAAQVIDVFDRKAQGLVSQNLFSVNETDIDRQYAFAVEKLVDETIPTRYIRKYGGEDVNVAKLEVILFANDNACAEAVEKFAERKYRAYVAAYRSKFATAAPDFQNMYDEIASAADEISEHNFELPRVMTDLPRAEDGIDYADHLFVDEESGTARIKLNTWEAGTLAAEQARKDFVCWLRNFERKRWALCLPYQDEGGEWKNFYPDMIIVRRGAEGCVADVLEPHDSTRRDNIGKARALAKYAANNQVVERIQLIRQVNGVLRRLDMMRGDIREKVLQASTNVELDNIFAECGTIS